MGKGGKGGMGGGGRSGRARDVCIRNCVIRMQALQGFIARLVTLEFRACGCRAQFGVALRCEAKGRCSEVSYFDAEPS